MLSAFDEVSSVDQSNPAGSTSEDVPRLLQGTPPLINKVNVKVVSIDISVMFSTHKTNSVNVACVVVLILGNRHFDLNLEH